MSLNHKTGFSGPPKAITPFPNVVALGTMHSKELALVEAFAELGVRIEVPDNIDTDAFGTFTGEVPRFGSMIDAARAKAIAAARLTGCDVGLGSEGAYGPHPVIPFIAAGKELLVWHDLRSGLDIFELLIDEAPNFFHIEVSSRSDAENFLSQIGFPKQGVVVSSPAAQAARIVEKGIRDYEALSGAFDRVLKSSVDSMVRIKTDMRAHMNPRRMEVIAKLGRRLVQRLSTNCPSCSQPGWGWVSVTDGLPCSNCGSPTSLPFKDVYACASCAAQEIIERDEPRSADPVYCPNCNP